MGGGAIGGRGRDEGFFGVFKEVTDALGLECAGLRFEERRAGGRMGEVRFSIYMGVFVYLGAYVYAEGVCQ